VFRFALLGLLAKQARHGYELKQSFERLLAGTWPVNIGQIYTTLARLERDGLVRSEVVPQSQVPDRKVFTLTPAGWDELHRWLSEPADATARLKDELFVKVLVHSLVDGGDPGELLWAQRQRLMEAMAELDEALADASTAPASGLVLEAAMLHLEADLRWLDLVEQRLGGR